MIARLIRASGSLFVYFCLATLISQAILVVYFASTWKINREKAVQVLAILQGVDLFEIKKTADGQPEPISPEQVSYEQIRATRAVKVRHLELREAALETARRNLAHEERKLAAEMRRYQNLREAFEQTLTDVQDASMAAGTEDVRAKLEGIKPKQAKELLVMMLKSDELDDVVGLMKAMPTAKAAKIMGEFKTAEETKQLHEILQRIGKGFPQADLAADTQRQLEQPEPGRP